MLNPGDAEAGQAGSVNGPLPRGEFLERELIAITCFVDRQEPAIDGSYDLTFAADDPTGRRGGRERLQRKGFTKGTNDLRGSEFLVFDHLTPVTTDRPRGHTSCLEEYPGLA